MPELHVRNCNVFYTVVGGGEPVILLHGGGSSSRQWKTLTSVIETEFLCCVPDLFGHGASSDWAGKQFPELADYAAIVEGLAAVCGEPFHLIGHSHGGAVAIAYAARFPKSLSSLALIEPTLMHLLRICNSPAWAEAQALGTKHIDAVSRGASAQIADEFLPYWIGEDAWQNMPGDRREAIIDTMPAVAQFWASEFAEATPAETYQQLDVPTLLVRGTRTRATAREIISLLAGLLPNSRLVEVEGAGHMAPLTHSSDVNEALANHLAGFR